MYCGTCLHDNALAAALLKLGHDVALVPTYTPIRTDEADVSIDRIFFGAVNVYLQQKLAGFRRRSLDRARQAGPAALGVAPRRRDRPDRPRRHDAVGAQGGGGLPGGTELEKLVAWLRDDRPEVVHLNNSMFAGFARRLKAEVGVPVLCSLQGEDLFLDGLREPWRSRVLDTLRQRAQDVDGYLVNSRFYADYMARWLDIPAERLHVVRLGLSLAGHGEDRPARPAGGPLTVGYLARVCPEKGLHLLVEAFRLLHERTPGRYRLRAAG